MLIGTKRHGATVAKKPEIQSQMSNFPSGLTTCTTPPLLPYQHYSVLSISLNMP